MIHLKDLNTPKRADFGKGNVGSFEFRQAKSFATVLRILIKHDEHNRTLTPEDEAEIRQAAVGMGFGFEFIKEDQ